VEVSWSHLGLNQPNQSLNAQTNRHQHSRIPISLWPLSSLNTSLCASKATGDNRPTYHLLSLPLAIRGLKSCSDGLIVDRPRQGVKSRPIQPFAEDGKKTVQARCHHSSHSLLIKRKCELDFEGRRGSIRSSSSFYCPTSWMQRHASCSCIRVQANKLEKMPVKSFTHAGLRWPTGRSDVEHTLDSRVVGDVPT